MESVKYGMKGGQTRDGKCQQVAGALLLVRYGSFLISYGGRDGEEGGGFQRYHLPLTEWK